MKSSTVMIALALTIAGPPCVFSQDKAGDLIELAQRSDGTKVWEILRSAVQQLEAQGEMTRAERIQLAKRFGLVLEAKGATPADVAVVLGPKHRKQVARQVCYHRYIEHWQIDVPLQLRITFDCRKGEDPKVRAAGVGDTEN